MRATLYRIKQNEKGTLGVLVVGGAAFYCLEPPWRDNQRNVSCIPSGITYPAFFLRRSASGKYRNVYHLQRVPGRTGILCHNGNIVAHTKGCILFGLKYGSINGEMAVLNSRAAMRKLNDLTKREPIEITIYGDNNAERAS